MDLECAARELLMDLCAVHPLGYIPHLFWKNYRVSAGMAYYRKGAIGLSKVVVDDEKKMHDTLKHEYAHLLAFKRHGRAATGHGRFWQEAMHDLGLEPRVRHSYTVLRNTPRQQVAYTCQRCGTQLLRSRRLPHKRRYVHAGCGGSIKYAWTRQVMLDTSKA